MYLCLSLLHSGKGYRDPGDLLSQLAVPRAMSLSCGFLFTSGKPQGTPLQLAGPPLPFGKVGVAGRGKSGALGNGQNFFFFFAFHSTKSLTPSLASQPLHGQSLVRVHQFPA